jgi:hypothetical protein
VGGIAADLAPERRASQSIDFITTNGRSQPELERGKHMTLTIGALRAEPGQKTRGVLPADLGSTTAEAPLILVNGSAPASGS